MKIDYRIKVYSNTGNVHLLSLLPERFSPQTILDVGFGDGANATVIQERYPGTAIDGITLSHKEADLVAPLFRDIWIADIQKNGCAIVQGRSYDLIIFSHVLEHLVEPAVVLKEFLQILSPGGYCLVAVPNILNFRKRLDFLLGNWYYSETGVMDKTHLRFFTYHNLEEVLELEQIQKEFSFVKIADTRLPLVHLLRKVGLNTLASSLDEKVGQAFPNLFGWQICLAIKRAARAD